MALVPEQLMKREFLNGEETSALMVVGANVEHVFDCEAKEDQRCG